MIYKFKSQAAGDVIMLQVTGDQMLAIVGKASAPRGIITVAQIPAALAALEAACAAHATEQSQPQAQPAPEPEVESHSAQLHYRAAPLIDLLKTSAQAGKDVVWGV